MRADYYKCWLETLEIISSEGAMADIKKARKELAKDKFYTLEDIFKKQIVKIMCRREVYG